MEWTIVSVIVVLIGLFFTIGKPILSVVKELQALRFETDRQEKEIDRDIESIKELSKIAQAHESRLEHQDSDIEEIKEHTSELLITSQAHEQRIIHLEQKD